MPIFLLGSISSSSRKRVKDDYGADSFGRIWLLIAHFFNAWFDGIHPSKDPWGEDWPEGSAEKHFAGKRISGNYFGVVWRVTGDLEYLTNELDLPGVMTDTPCWQCAANRSDIPFTDTRPGARWRTTLYHDAGPSPSPHPVFQIKGVTRFMCTGDLMHTSCLGVAAYVVGAVLWDIVRSAGFRGSIEERVATLWGYMEAAFDELPGHHKPYKFSALIFRPMRQDSFPGLRNIKAKDTQGWLRAVQKVCRHPHIHSGSQLDEMRATACDDLVLMYDTYGAAGDVPTDEEATVADEAVDRFLRNVTQLSNWHLRAGTCMYPFTFKFHLLKHITLNGFYMNPRCTWCYEWEDFVGRIKISAMRCLASSDQSLIPKKVMQNCCLASVFDMMRRD